MQQTPRDSSCAVDRTWQSKNKLAPRKRTWKMYSQMDDKRTTNHEKNENARLFFSSFVVHWWVSFPSSFPDVSTSPAVSRFFFKTNSKKNLSPTCRPLSCRPWFGFTRSSYQVSLSYVLHDDPAEIQIPSVEENPELKGSPFKAWSRPEKVVHASPTARDFFLELISILPVHSPAFFPNLFRVFLALAVAKTSSCVGLKNNICHPAHRYRQLMQVHVLSARGM